MLTPQPASVFALVAYIPGPLGEFLDRLRESFPGHNGSRSHLTLLPPRRLDLTGDRAAALINGILGKFTAFTVELTEVCRFPRTEVLYMDLGEGDLEAHALHDSLNLGELFFDEPFEYSPHITLVLPTEGADISEFERCIAASWQAAPVPRRFVVDTLHLVRQLPNGRWERVAESVLQPKRTGHASR